MPGYRVKRFLQFNPSVRYFKPVGVPMRSLDEVILTRDEVEALKLHDIDGLDQKDSAMKMGISQPTFARTLDWVYKKVADAIINGKALVLEA